MKKVILALLVTISAPAFAAIDGLLGPMRLQMEGVDAALRLPLQNSIRKNAANVFTGNSDYVYRLDINLRQIDTIKKMTRPKIPSGGLAIHVYSVSLKLSLFRPYSEDVAGAVMSMRSVSEAVFERSAYYPDPDENLRNYVPRQVDLFLKSLDGQSVEEAQAALQFDMSEPRGKPPAALSAIYTVGNGLIDASKAVGGVVWAGMELLGDPQVAAAINGQIAESSARLSAMNRENYQRSANLQAMLYEAEDRKSSELVADLNRTNPAYASPAPARRTVVQPALSSTAPARQVDQARQRCLDRGAQWDDSRRICFLERSESERRQACMASGGVFYEQQRVCWRQIGSSTGYVSDSFIASRGDTAGGRKSSTMRGGEETAAQSSGGGSGVCAGPFTVASKTVEGWDQWVGNFPHEKDKCPENTTFEYLSPWPELEQEVVKRRKLDGLDSVMFNKKYMRLTKPAYEYHCLCGGAGHKGGSSATQQ